MVRCWHGYLSGMRCRLAYGPADATATHCLLLPRLDLPFWYRLIRVVPEKGPLNVCVCVCACVRACVRACMCDCVFHRLTTLLLRKLSLILLTLCCLIMTFVTLQMWFISEHVECITSTYMHLAQSSCVACLMYIMSDDFNRSSSCR